MLLKGFTTADAAHLSGFTIRQLDYWNRQKFLIPSIKRSNGPGTRRTYSFDDLVQLRFIRRLKDLGWSTQKTRQAVNKLRNLMSQSFERPVIVPGKQMILAICKTKENERILIDALNPSGQQVMWIVIDSLVEETKNVIAGAFSVQTSGTETLRSANAEIVELVSHSLDEAV